MGVVMFKGKLLETICPVIERYVAESAWDAIFEAAFMAL